MSPFVLSDADLASTTALAARRRAVTTVADATAAALFGDELTRALHREAVYSVPDSERSTCPLHLEWRSHCIDLHVRAA